METGKRLIVLRGLPGSGKSTWAESSGHYTVSRDNIRRVIVGHDAKTVLSLDEEKLITETEEIVVKGLLALTDTVVIDSTNLRRKYCVRWDKFAKREGVEIEFKKFETDVDLCVKRDATRGDNRVGEKVIRDMASRFLRKGRIRDFVASNDDNKETDERGKYEGTPGASDCVIVDIDGTVALNTGGRGWFDWARVGEDTKNEAVCKIVESLISDNEMEIIFVSGRSEECRDETMLWIERELGIEAGEIVLFMRPVERMYEKDSIMKRDLFWDEIAPHWNVVAVFDDRNQVVDMWRGLGLTCLQVAEGDF